MGFFLLVLAPVCHATCDGGAECGIRSSRLRFGFEVEFISNALRPTVENVLALNGLTDDHWRHKVLESRQDFNLTIEACSGTDRLVCTRPEIVTDPVTVAGAQGLLESIDAWTRTGLPAQRSNRALVGGTYTSVRCERERHQQFLHARTDEPFKAAEAQIRAGRVGLEE